MERPSELQDFLRTHSAEGVKDSEGEFSISREKALAKLASFQLPFEGAWSLKIVQALVASKKGESLKVSLGRTTGNFYLRGSLGWTLDAIEEALLDPDYDDDRAIGHFISALRAVGMSQKRGFWLAIPSEPNALAWDGKTLTRTPVKTQMSSITLQVTAAAIDDEGGFLGIKGYRAVSQRNASVTKILTMMAHTSSIPLTLDGRRIDALELNQDHGWSSTSQLLVLGLEEGDLQPLPVPRATGTSLTVDAHRAGELEEVTEATRARDYSVETCALAFLTSVHMERVKKGKSYTWEDREAHCLLNWVQDGVIIETEALSRRMDIVSVGAFVCADGLKTDLTSFKILEDEKADIRERARTILVNGIKKSDQIDFEEMYRKAKSTSQAGGAVFLILGIGVCTVSPLHGLFMSGMGLIGMIYGGSSEKEQGERISRALGRLERNLTER